MVLKNVCLLSIERPRTSLRNLLINLPACNSNKSLFYVHLNLCTRINIKIS